MTNDVVRYGGTGEARFLSLPRSVAVNIRQDYVPSVACGGHVGTQKGNGHQDREARKFNLQYMLCGRACDSKDPGLVAVVLESHSAT